MVFDCAVVVLMWTVTACLLFCGFSRSVWFDYSAFGFGFVFLCDCVVFVGITCGLWMFGWCRLFVGTVFISVVWCLGLTAFGMHLV